MSIWIVWIYSISIYSSRYIFLSMSTNYSVASSFSLNFPGHDIHWQAGQLYTYHTIQYTIQTMYNQFWYFFLFSWKSHFLQKPAWQINWRLCIHWAEHSATPPCQSSRGFRCVLQRYGCILWNIRGSKVCHWERCLSDGMKYIAIRVWIAYKKLASSVNTWQTTDVQWALGVHLCKRMLRSNIYDLWLVVNAQ